MEPKLCKPLPFSWVSTCPAQRDRSADTCLLKGLRKLQGEKLSSTILILTARPHTPQSITVFQGDRWPRLSAASITELEFWTQSPMSTCPWILVNRQLWKQKLVFKIFNSQNGTSTDQTQQKSSPSQGIPDEFQPCPERPFHETSHRTSRHTEFWYSSDRV